MVTERRDCPRYKVRARCHIQGAVSGVFTGWTEDVGRAGVLVEISTGAGVWLPALGEKVTIDIELPPSDVFGRKCLRCSGDVVRVCANRGCAPRIALSFVQVEFADAAGRFQAIDGSAAMDRLLRVK